MCGIAGHLGALSGDLLPAMLRTLKHRGPDGDGMHVEPGAAIGMTRLAIIDLVGGAQPMPNADGSCLVVFNGEIYNFRELRRELEAAGHAFRTRSDTEVIVHAYDAWGDACVERLRGMFAFALWDRRRRRLLLARDRLGKKPLYYWQRAGVFLFASEIKALLCHPAVARDVDAEALHHYLAFGYTPAERSIFGEIAKLPPAHVGVIEDGRLTMRRYWSLPAYHPGEASEGPPLRSANDAAARVREELRDAVRLRLESDVPLGVFLSGGIDSSAIVACMREITTGRITTVSIGFGPSVPSFDELPYARQVAQRFATDHHEEVLEPAVASLLPAIVHHFDEPFADSSAVPTFVVAQATARHVKVALSGVGGDELFAGYPRYLGVRVAERYAALPRVLRALPEAVLRALPESDASRSLVQWGRRFVAGAALPLPDRYLAWTRFLGEAALARLVRPDVRRRWREPVDAAARAAFASRAPGDPVDGAQRIDLATYLPGDLLVMGDRMSMAHSLELRAPFCDSRLIETVLAWPSTARLPGRALKGLLKRAFADVLPPALLTRRKQGFMIPLARWLRTSLRPLMDDLLAPDVIRARGLFEPAEVARLRTEHLGGRRAHADRLWSLLMLEAWMRQYLDGHGTWSAR